MPTAGHNNGEIEVEKVLTGTETAAEAAALARVEVVPAYPITPQTVIVEALAEMIGRGDLDATYINVESEHSAMASCIGAAAAGARTFTATSSQGLALMHEVLHYAANGRLPIVMVNANRSLAPPWNLYCDQSDSLAQRDTGWIQYYCADCQDVLDSIIVAYKVAEEVSLPVMINMDAFYLTHTSEAVQLPDQRAVDAFIPKRIKSVLNSDQPVTFGNVCGADLYTSLRYVRHHDTNAALEVWQNASDEYAKTFGRSCPPLQTYKTEDAETILVVAGSAAGTLRLTADQLREEGHAAGVMRPALFRPFPAGLIAQTVSAAKRVIVVERGVSNGMGGIIGQELKAGLFGRRNGLEVWSLFAGLGGKDIVPEEIAAEVKSIAAGEKTNGALNDNSLWTGLLS
jgi:pyruvate/2-oxoacid:ferredoxin oxidoreductase alpha subunit